MLFSSIIQPNKLRVISGLILMRVSSALSQVVLCFALLVHAKSTVQLSKLRVIYIRIECIGLTL